MPPIPGLESCKLDTTITKAGSHSHVQLLFQMWSVADPLTSAFHVGRLAKRFSRSRGPVGGI